MCSAVAAAALTVGTFPIAHAQDLEPRSYSNAPVGLNFLIAGYAYTQGGVAFDGSLPLTNPQLDPIGKIPEYKYCAVKIGRAHDEPHVPMPDINVTASGL